MNQKKYYTFYSKHQSIYIFNISSADLIKLSLQFYSPTNMLNVIKFKIFELYLNILRFIPYFLIKSKLYGKNDIKKIIKSFKKEITDLEIKDNSSILISPTRDKIIINNNNEFFRKFAFNGSYTKVKNEVEKYNFLNLTKIKNFHIPTIYDIKDNSLDQISFNIRNKPLRENKSQCIKEGLIEIFSLSNKNLNVNKKTTITSYVENLEMKLKINDINLNSINSYLKNIKKFHGNETINLGFVHGDFKKSNLKFVNNQIILFDFEEATFEGIPLFDYFNYIIDPLILNYKSSQIAKNMLLNENTVYYKKYLDKAKEHLDYKILLSLFIINRIISYVIWKRDGYLNQFISLFEELNEK